MSVRRGAVILGDGLLIEHLGNLLSSEVSYHQTLLANLRAVGLGDLLWSKVRSGARRTPEAVDDDDVATVRPCGPGKHGAGGAGGVPEGMPSDPDP